MRLSKKTFSHFFVIIMAIQLCLTLSSCAVNSDAEFSAAKNLVTRTTDFSKDWLFAHEPNGNVQDIDYDDSEWRKLDLPHDWSIELDFDSSVPTAVGALKGGTGWYRKHITLPAEYAGKRISIDFDGVYMNSRVYVNGELVGNYPNGYVSFSFDITDYVVCDGITDNVIAVFVCNPTDKDNTTSRWYSGSGIYRDVHLTVTDNVHIEQYGTQIRTPRIADQIKSGKISVEAVTTVENESDTAVSVQLRSTILDYDGTAFEGSKPKLSGKKKVSAGKSLAVKQSLTANAPKLWSVDEPNLYLMKTEVIVDGVIVDIYYTRFGFTWSEFDADKGFFLNGEWMKINGVCLHHDQGALGSVANESAFERQIRIMKEMGVNAIRTSHNAADPDFIRLCDEMGMMVFEESFDTWWNGKNNQDYGRIWFAAKCTYPGVEDGMTWGEFDIKQIVKRDRNCPSIIMWSVGNECNETSSEEGAEFAATINSWVKEVDANHPVAMGENKYKLDWSNKDNLTNTIKNLDLAGLNYGEMWYDRLHEENPEWKLFGSETSSAYKCRGWYSSPWINGNHIVDNVMGNQAPDIQKGQISSYDNSSSRFGRSATQAWILNRDREYVAGQFVWTGFDYIGEPDPHYVTSKSSYFGIVDTAGFAKDEYYLYQSVWTSVEENPMVHIMPHWNWENDDLRKKVTYPEKSELEYLDEGEIVDYSDEDIGKIPIRIYSNAPKVELFLNGESLGIKEFAQMVTDYGLKYQQQSEDSDRLYLELALEWKYAVGTTIEAVAYDKNVNEVARDTVVTAGSAASLAAIPEKQKIAADGKSLCYIEVDVLDEFGNFVPTANNEVIFTIEGDGVIVGVDNGNPISRERYKDTDGVWKRCAYSGKVLVIVQSTAQSGSFTLTASSNGLESSNVTVGTVSSEKQAN